MPGPENPHRPNPLQWPLTPENLDGLDATIEDIYQWLRKIRAEIDAIETASADAVDEDHFDYTDFLQDLGAGDRAGTFDITGLGGLTPDTNVNIIQTMQPIASKGNARDEFELQPIILTGYVLDANTIRVLWNCDSICVGEYAFAFAVSA